MQLIRISLLRELDPQEMEDKRNAAEQAECPFGMATNLKDRQSSQKSGLDGQAWTEGEAHTWSWGLRFTQSVEDEKDRRRGHVAVVGQNLMRDIQGKPIQAHSFGDSRENPRPARMDCPGAHPCLVQAMMPQPVLQPRSQMLADQVRDSWGKAHLEPLIADTPGHRVFRIIDHGRARSEDSIAMRPGGFIVNGNDRGGSVGEKCIGHDLVGIPSVLVVQAAEFESAEQHTRGGIRVKKRSGHAQAVERAMAAHEANMCTSHLAGQGQLLDQTDVETGA